MLQTIAITVTGLVQGVFFRQSTREKATALGIKGKVMNLPDGEVKIIATGEPEKLAELIEWCRQGPPKAAVTSVTHEELPLQEFDSFRVQRY